MQALHTIAEAYWRVASDDIRTAARNFFDEMDRDRNNKVSLDEFLASMTQEPYRDLGIGRKDLFKKLCRGRNKNLDFMDVMTLYYIILSGRPFCNGCDEFIQDIYFCCIECFNSSNGNYCLCVKCFRSEIFSHHRPHNQFMDNFTLLAQKRRDALGAATAPKKGKFRNRKSDAQGNASSSGSRDIVPAGPQTAPEMGKLQGLAVALKAFETSLAAASHAAVAFSCVVM